MGGVPNDHDSGHLAEAGNGTRLMGQGSAGDEWIPYQEMLLAMIPSTVDEVVARFNADSLWKDPRSIAQVVVSVAGGRKNGPELIEFMQKISDTRGYSGIFLKAEEIEALLRDPLIEGNVTGVIARVCTIPTGDASNVRQAAIREVVDFLPSDSFGLQAALNELVRLTDAIADPPKE
jgi:hypothetical protein